MPFPDGRWTCLHPITRCAASELWRRVCARSSCDRAGVTYSEGEAMANPIYERSRVKLDAVRMVSASGILGYGFPESSFKAALERKPHMVGVDGGSSDPGPHYLGSGKTLNSRLAMKRDLSLLLRGAIANGIPMMVGTSGGAGGEPHLQACADIIREIAREHDLHFKMALIHSEQDKAFLKSRLKAGRVRALGRAHPLTEATIDKADRIVGM